MTEEDLLNHYPRLYHMAEDGSWESIQKYGLLSTNALLTLYGYQGQDRRKLVCERRPESVAIARPGLPGAVVRDQKPLTHSALQKCLIDGTTPEEWFEILNERVFFWLSKERLLGLLGARAYRNRPQTVITLDSASVVSAHRTRMSLSPINSGATIYRPTPRGRGTFMSISEFPFEERRRRKAIKDAVVELTVLGGLRDVMKHVIVVHRVKNGTKRELWRRAGTHHSEGP